jgi:predicted Rossmann fold nucleotide-binding protein DprA/Smf involved in DNA uptake
MEIEKGKTYKYLREKHEVTQDSKDKMKYSGKMKKTIMDALKESDLTIDQLTDKINMPKDEIVFWVMSLLKYGHIQPGEIDDMDEYFTYKIKL